MFWLGVAGAVLVAIYLVIVDNKKNVRYCSNRKFFKNETKERWRILREKRKFHKVNAFCLVLRV